MTTPLTGQQLTEITARFEATTHPGWRDTTDLGRVLAEVRRLRAGERTARDQVSAIALIRVWRNEDGAEFMFADEIRAALDVPTRTAAQPNSF